MDRLTAELENLRQDLAPVLRKDEADKIRFAKIDERLDSIESWQRWIGRTVGALVLAAIISGVIVTGAAG